MTLRTFATDARFDPPASVDTRHAAVVGPKATLMDQSSRHTRQRLTLALATMVIFVIAALFATRVMGQDNGAKYESFPMNPALTEAVIKRVETTTKQFVSTGSGDPRMVTAYFGHYVPAKMTAPDAAKDMSAIVDEVSAYIARVSRTNRTDVAQKITEEAFKGMKLVAEGNYHPSARISAILLLSRLDQKQADNRAKAPPVPLTFALPVLMKLYEDTKNVDGVRAAALQGIHRHVSYGFPMMDANVKAQITKDMTELLDSDAPAGRSGDVHAYLQRYAVDILATLRPDDDASLGVKLIGISTKNDAPDMIALHSAASIGSMGTALQGKVANPEKVLKSWAGRALDAFESEIERFANFERAKPAMGQPKDPEQFLNKDAGKKPTKRGMPDMEQQMMGSDYSQQSMGSGPDMSQMMGDYSQDMNSMRMPGMIPEAKPQPPEVIGSRRKLNYVLQQINLGVTGKGSAGVPSRDPGGLLASVADDKKEVVTNWITSMEEVVTALNDKNLDDQTKYLKGLEEQIEMLREIVGEEPPNVFGDEKDVAVDPNATPEAAEAEEMVGFN